MIRKLFCASIVMAIAVGFAAADEFAAIVTKVDGNKVTYFKTKKGKKDGDAVTSDAAKDVVVAKGVFDKDTKKFNKGDAIEGGLKAKIFADINAEKGVAVRLTTEGDKITQVLVTAKKGAK